MFNYIGQYLLKSEQSWAQTCEFQDVFCLKKYVNVQLALKPFMVFLLVCALSIKDAQRPKRAASGGQAKTQAKKAKVDGDTPPADDTAMLPVPEGRMFVHMLKYLYKVFLIRTKWQ